MGEDDIIELLRKSGQIVSSSQTQRPTSDPPILRGGGGGEGNAPFPIPPLYQPSHQNLLIHEHEMASWPQHQSFCSGVAYTPATLPQCSVSLAPPPPPSAPYDPPPENLSRVRGNIFTPWIPVVRESTEYSLIPVTESTETRPTVTFGVSHTFVVLGPGRKEKAVATETETAHDRKRKEREETIEETEEARGSTSRKRSRAAEMHNFSERRRREKINEKMKALQELIPRCNKSDKASMLDDAIEYVKSLQMQIQMMSMGCSMMPAMYTQNMQRFLPHMAMGMMGMNRPPFIPFPGTPPFPRQAHMAELGPSYPSARYPFPNIQAFYPSKVHLPSQQHDPVSNQPQFPGYLNPYSQFVGLQQMQQPPPLQNQTSQLSFGQASSSKEPEDQENQPTG